MSKDEDSEVISNYIETYGHTVTTISAGPKLLARVVYEMRRCLRGQRGPLTDEEFYGDFPEDRVM